ncbi:MAG: hypothetical protein GW762_01405 [Candidatus Pacebacteria bacterium]|nr:hypothetical protein [Candidatus Paceibacterota bacterium]
MKMTWFLLLVVLFLAACDGAPTPAQPVEMSSSTVSSAEVQSQVSSVDALTGSSETGGVNTGYCPPGDLKIESGQWYYCSGPLGTSEWKLTADLYFGSESMLKSRLDSGESFLFFPALAVTVLDGFPGDELLVLAFGTMTIAAVSQSSANMVNFDLSAPPVQINSLPEFQQWKTTNVQMTIVDQVGVLDLASPIDASDLEYKAPAGSTAVLIEDNPMWAGLLIKTLAVANITTIGVYPNCDAWRAARVTGLPVIAHVYVVDQHAGDGVVFGHTCVAEIATLLPPPLVIAGFSAENLDQVTEKWSPGQESSVRELFEENGADFVIQNADQLNDLYQLVLEVLGRLG